MKTTSSIRRAWGYVKVSRGNSAGDIAPRYDVILDEPPDMAGKRFSNVLNDSTPTEGAKVRPAPVDSDVLVTWNKGERRVHVFGEKIIFETCSPNAPVRGTTMMEKIKEFVFRGGPPSTAEAGGSVPGSDPGSVGGL